MTRPIIHIGEIVSWAKEFRQLHGRLPHRDDGIIGLAHEPRLTWYAIDQALLAGHRGLRPGSSLAKLWLQKFGRRHSGLLPNFTIQQVLEWADAYHARTGAWPTRDSGLVEAGSEETWSNVNVSLIEGARGFRPGSTLAKLLAKHRGVRNRKALPKLPERKILEWAAAHEKRFGRWPIHSSGAIAEQPGETWNAVESALRHGGRGLPGGSSLAQLLAEMCGVPNRLRQPHFSIEQILAWADAHHARAGVWPKGTSGAVLESPAETWNSVNQALRKGLRGLPKGSSLPQLLAKHRGVRNRQALEKLEDQKILAWADAHFERTGRWPTKKSGPIQESSEETWSSVGTALEKGARGLPAGDSLFQLLQRHGRLRSRIQKTAGAG